VDFYFFDSGLEGIWTCRWRGEKCEPFFVRFMKENLGIALQNLES